jgi:hypothetical protein
MIKKQSTAKSFYSRQEDRASPGAIFRLSLVYEGDEGLLSASRILCWLVNAERNSDFVGPGQSRNGGSSRRTAFITHRSDLAASWNAVLGDIRFGHAVSSVSSCFFTENLLDVLERRYARFHELIAKGPIREEVLANCARQYREARTFLAAFLADISARASSMAHDIQARFVGNHYLTLFKPCMDFLLDSASGLIPGGIAPEGLDCSALDELLSVAPVAKTAASKAKAAPPAALPQATPSFNFGSPPHPTYGSFPHYGPPPPWQAFGPPAQYPFFGTPPAAPAASPPSQPAPPYVSPAATGGGGAGVGAHSNPSVTHPRAGAGGAVVKLEDKGPKFLSQPQHEWITGEDSRVVTGKRAWSPPCGCANHTGNATGAHATWDCPLRYWKMCGSCPGFFPSGIKDPAQWDGVNLTAAAKVAWRALIKDFDLPLPREPNARPTPF